MEGNDDGEKSSIIFGSSFVETRTQSRQWNEQKLDALDAKKRRHSLQCYEHGAHPAPAAPCGWAVRA